MRESGDRQQGSGKRRTKARGPKRFTISMQKRLVVLFGIVLASFFLLGFRLYLIQRDKGRSYTMQVLSQQKYDNKVLPYKRGRITDCNGTVLADSQLVFNVIVDVKQMLAKEGQYYEPTLRAAVGLGVDQQKLEEYVKEHPGSQYYIARKNLPYTDRKAFEKELQEGIEAEKADLKEAEKQAEREGREEASLSEKDLYYSNIKGIWFEDNYIRFYPCNTLAADVIGFTVGDRGSFGLEEYYDEELSGVKGRTYGYLDGSLNMELTTIQPRDGNSLELTLDANIQSICEKYLKEFNEELRNNKHKGNGFNNAACLIMDIQTGGILAMASEPGFNLNDPYDISVLAGSPKLNDKDVATTKYLTAAEAEALTDEQRTHYLNALWNNFCIGTHFEPGSTAKPFTTAAGLETGTLKKKDKFVCNGTLLVGGTYVPCAHVAGDGEIDISEAIERSCNVALMQEAEKIGSENFCRFQNIFNFGLRTNVDLAGEARTDDYLYSLEDMTDIDLATNSFGQNFEATMIQMASGFCSLINGGSYYQPYVVKRIVSAGGSTVKETEPRILKKTVSEETSTLIRQFCIKAVEGENATGVLARPAGYRIGGKTGTAETLPRENGQYIVSFMGFAPAVNPRILIYVVLDRINNKKQDEAGRACRVARKILTEVLPYMKIYMTEPLNDLERVELEAMGLYDTNAAKNTPGNGDE